MKANIKGHFKKGNSPQKQMLLRGHVKKKTRTWPLVLLQFYKFIHIYSWLAKQRKTIVFPLQTCMLAFQWACSFLWQNLVPCVHHGTSLMLTPTNLSSSMWLFWNSTCFPKLLLWPRFSLIFFKFLLFFLLTLLHISQLFLPLFQPPPIAIQSANHHTSVSMGYAYMSLANAFTYFHPV